jgi:hypothetical protein
MLSEVVALPSVCREAGRDALRAFAQGTAERDAPVAAFQRLKARV